MTSLIQLTWIQVECALRPAATFASSHLQFHKILPLSRRHKPKMRSSSFRGREYTNRVTYFLTSSEGRALRAPEYCVNYRIKPRGCCPWITHSCCNSFHHISSIWYDTFHNLPLGHLSGPCVRAASSVGWHGYDGLSVWLCIRGHVLESASEVPCFAGYPSSPPQPHIYSPCPSLFSRVNLIIVKSNCLWPLSFS